jgi:hypothetical protein
VNLLLFLLLPLAVVASAPANPDTLVVCSREFRPALTDWEQYRRAQGHEFLFIEPAQRAEELQATIRRAGHSGRLKYLVLIGDESARVREPRANQQSATRNIPTNYVRAKVNVRWGSEAEIATDAPFGDLDGDGVPDLAIGRIPAHSVGELAGVVRKIIRYEQQGDHGPWEKCLNIVCGTGGFGAVTDAMVEAAGRQVIQQTVPADYNVQQLSAAASTNERPEIDFGLRARRQLNDGGLAWVYVGHGMPTRLEGFPGSRDRQPILSTRDVSSLHCGPHNPLAVLIACYTGAMDAPYDCLGEDLLLAQEGPVAVIAATRVTMPYGNTVMGYELLRACFQDQPAELGEVVRLAQSRVLKQSPNDQLRAMLDGMAEWLSPAPVDLPNERREHVLMYHLIGDPLLRLHRPAPTLAERSNQAPQAR